MASAVTRKQTRSFISLIKVTKFVTLILTVKNGATDRERKLIAL
jgi:hypothetical protein